MRIFRLISGITLLTGSAWIGPALSGVLGISETLASAAVSFLGGMLFYSGLPFVGKKTVTFGKV